MPNTEKIIIFVSGQCTSSLLSARQRRKQDKTLRYLHLNATFAFPLMNCEGEAPDIETLSTILNLRSSCAHSYSIGDQQRVHRPHLSHTVLKETCVDAEICRLFLFNTFY
jgi:hypothetical protein